MNPIVVLLGLALIVANLLVSPQGKLLVQALGNVGPASAGAFPGQFPARGPGASGSGGGARVVPPDALPPVGIPGGGAPALPPIALPPGVIP